jgi:RNase_H superfamily
VVADRRAYYVAGVALAAEIEVRERENELQKAKPSESRILLLDVETAPIEAYVWALWDQNVGLNQIKNEWSILSYAAKWLDGKRVMYADTGGRGAENVRDDKPLMGPLWELLDAADIVVGQNARRFDVKKINARLLMHGYGPYSPIRIIDTLSVAKKHFAFTSNKLEWQSKYLTDSPKSKHKKFEGFELWAQCLKDNPAAWLEMRRYNKQDVVALEKLYLKQRPWIAGHPSVTVHIDPTTPSCPSCGSTRMQRRGVSVVRAGGSYPRLQCQSCGSWSRGKTSTRTRASSAKQLVSIS